MYQLDILFDFSGVAQGESKGWGCYVVYMMWVIINNTKSFEIFESHIINT